MTGNSTKVNKKSSKKAKWPFIVFGSISAFFIIFIVTFSSLIIADKNTSKKELPEMAEDFGTWYKNGFLGYSEWEGNYLHFPDGTSDTPNKHFGDYQVRYPIAISDNRILEYLSFKDSNEEITEIRLTSWCFDNEKTLLRLSGRYLIDETFEGNIRLWLSENSNTSYVINVENGQVHQEELSEYLPYSFGNLSARYGIFKSSQDGYLAILPNEKEYFIQSNAMDEEIVLLLKKWAFKPYRSRLSPDGSILCSFIRKTLFGQNAIIIMSYDVSDGFLSYQFFPIFTSYQDNNRIILYHCLLTDRIDRFLLDE